jgi:hypothetical protein
LRDDAGVIEGLKQQGLFPISTEQGELCATELGAYAYVECSALTQKGLSNVFEHGVRGALKYSSEWQNPKSRLKKKKGVCIVL